MDETTNAQERLLPPKDTRERDRKKESEGGSSLLIRFVIIALVVNVAVTSLGLFLFPQVKEAKCSYEDAPSWGPLGLRGLSHISLNVPDVDEAADFYNRVLGFEIMSAGELWGDFIFRELDDEAFCKSAGFMDGKCKLDCIWMWHPHIHVNLELFHYVEPNVTNYLLQELPRTQDIGGIKHISYVVADADSAFAFLKMQPDVTMISDNPQYKPVRMDPLPFKFFYWRDPYGVQWECEEGDKVVTYQVPGLTRLMDDYAQFKN